MSKVKMLQGKRFSFFSKEKKDDKIGTLKGVFIPNILQMIGVILFMRLGWILGQVGMLQMGIIIGISSTLLLITSLSLTSVLSNMKIEGGGTYYLISRTLGIEFGSAIGILLCISQLVSIALSVSGFSLSLYEFMPNASLMLIKLITIATLMGISYFSTDLALKTQILIFVTLFISISSVFTGSSENIPAHIQPLQVGTTLSFWAAFAMFFPATTGIDSGMSMSGDLKNPSRSIPLGTIGSVLAAFFLYFNLAYFLSKHASSELLVSYPMLPYYLSKYGFLVILGIWGATLSSAMGSILGAPRVMQAIASDGILPGFLAKGSGKNNQPKVAMVVVFFLALGLTLFTDINQIIPILTMACLICYGLLNFLCFSQEFLKNPSWRPTFRVHWSVSMLGFIGCISAMFMINPGATFIVLILTACICVWTTRQKVQGNWDDLRYSLFSYLVQSGTKKLISLEKNPKSWRPHILTLFDSPMISKNLAFFSQALNQEKGLLTFGTVIEDSANRKAAMQNMENSASICLKSYEIPSYVHVYSTKQRELGFNHIVTNYGLGPLKPNTIVLSINDHIQSPISICPLLMDTFHHEKNILLLKENEQSNNIFTSFNPKKKQINLWWGGEYEKNFELSLALSQILQISRVWLNSRICIKTLVKDKEMQAKKTLQFDRYQKRLRMKNLAFLPIVDPELEFVSALSKYSADADLTFLGLRAPDGDKPEEYQKYYENFMKQTNELKNIVFVLAGEDLSFEKIFFT